MDTTQDRVSGDENDARFSLLAQALDKGLTPDDIIAWVNDHRAQYENLK